MPRIHLLPPHVISTIAAGEVAERPSVIVKELLENALDAEATQITITLDQGGIQRIVITDNGHGMDAEDLELAIQRHTTSKLRSSEDLESIATFGFRGEALASIGSVARLTVQSKPPTAEVGYQLVVENSQVEELQPIGIPDGTTVVVDRLFEALPARKKFLRQPQTELKHILEVVMAAALSHPESGFTLINNHQLLLKLEPGHSAIERVTQLLGNDTSAHLLPLDSDHSHYQVKGFIGKPQLARRGQPPQFIFINKRFVTHPPINRLIKDLYGSLIEPKAEPIFIIDLTLPQPLIDINVHPRKETVKFLDEKPVFEVIKNALTQSLNTTDLTYRYTYPLRDRDMSEATGQVLKEYVTPWHFDAPTSGDILQIHNTYLLTQSAEGLLLVDQHAAHERILYEQFLAAFKEEKIQSQKTILPKPELLQLSFTDAHLLQEHLETLHTLGFELDLFGGQTIKLTAVPTLLKDRDFTQLISGLLADLDQGKPVTGLDTIAERTLAYLACRNAVKAGHPLNASQRRELLEKLDATSSNFTCPHGRPVSIICDLHELEKMFKRSGF